MSGLGSQLWPSDVQELCRIAARPHSVSPDVHQDDFIFRFLYENPVFTSKASAIGYYFDDGENSAKKVRQQVDRWLPKQQESLKILEFASGYGAVTRHAKKALSPHILHSSDIHSLANEFNKTNFEVHTVQSNNHPEKLIFPVRYDVIFVLSFFSHMPLLTWGRWLRRLYEGLSAGGILLFTTHGKLSMKYFPHAALDSSGFWFSHTSEQRDLDTASYGQTITSKQFVDARVAEIDGADHLFYEQGGWWGHQDLYIIRKTGGE